MKKLYMTLCVAAGLLMSACGGNKNHDTSDSGSDSALTAEMESAVAGPTDYYLTADSIGPVKVGDVIAQLPAAVANLYDNIVENQTPDAMAYTFRLADVPQFTVYDFMEGKVDVIALEGDSRGVMTPDGALRTGDPFTKVLALKGVESTWEGIDEGGMWYWKWNGIYFAVDETDISEQFADKLNNDKAVPRAADFTEGIKIGYIATGLPF